MHNRVAEKVELTSAKAIELSVLYGDSTNMTRGTPSPKNDYSAILKCNKSKLKENAQISKIAAKGRRHI